MTDEPTPGFAPDLEDEVDRLYGLPLEEFTPARNELAKRLRKDGRKAEAARVGELAKPSLALWTVNQLARGDSSSRFRSSGRARTFLSGCCSRGGGLSRRSCR